MNGEGEASNTVPEVGKPITTAGFLRRAVAAVVDSLVVGWPVGGIVVLLDFFHRPIAREPLQVVAVLWAAMTTYSILMLGRFGWTVGMRALKVRVARADGTPINYRTAALRTLAYQLPGIVPVVLDWLGWAIAEGSLGIVWTVAVLWLVVDRNHQGYHDKIAGTFVVHGVKHAPGEAGPTGVVTLPASRRLRAAKWAAFVTISLVAMSLHAVMIVPDVAASRAERQVEAILAQLKAEGKPLTEAALVPPPVPDAENAALVYEQTYKRWQSSAEEQEAVDQALKNWLCGRPLGEDIAPEKLAALKPPPVGDSTDARALAVVKRTVERNRDSLALLHKAAGMEKWRSSRKPGGGNMPWVPNSRPNARRLALEAMVRADEGDADGALRAAMTAVDLSNFLGEPSFITALIRMIMCRVGVEATERVLFDSTPSPDACRATEAVLAKADLRTAMVRGLEGERAWVVELFEKVRNSTNPLEQLVAILRTGEATSSSERSRGRLVRFLAWRTAADELYFLTYMDLWIRQMQTPTFEQDPGLSARLDHLQPPDKPGRAYEIWHVLLFIVFPRLINTNQRVGEEETAVALTRVALLLKAYRGERGAYPESLNDLEGYLGKELPLDPCSGKPLHYQREGSGFTLYSVGLDGVDDGGAIPEGKGPIPILGSLAGGGKDIVWVCRE